MIEKTFENEGTFAALHAAQIWCYENGISYGSLCGRDPVGLMWGDYAISKWHNLTADERRECHGTMTAGNFRDGPVKIKIIEKPIRGEA